MLEDRLELSHVLDINSLGRYGLEAGNNLVLYLKQWLSLVILKEGCEAMSGSKSSCWVVQKFDHWQKKVIQCQIQEQIVLISSLYYL